MGYMQHMKNIFRPWVYGYDFLWEPLFYCCFSFSLSLSLFFFGFVLLEESLVVCLFFCILIIIESLRTKLRFMMIYIIMFRYGG